MQLQPVKLPLTYEKAESELRHLENMAFSRFLEALAAQGLDVDFNKQSLVAAVKGMLDIPDDQAVMLFQKVAKNKRLEKIGIVNKQANAVEPFDLPNIPIFEVMNPKKLAQSEPPKKQGKLHPIVRKSLFLQPLTPQPVADTSQMILIDFNRKRADEIRQMNLKPISEYKLPPLETVQKIPQSQLENLRVICLSHITEMQKHFNEIGQEIDKDDIDRLRRVFAKENRWLTAQDELRIELEEENRIRRGVDQDSVSVDGSVTGSRNVQGRGLRKKPTRKNMNSEYQETDSNRRRSVKDRSYSSSHHGQKHSSSNNNNRNNNRNGFSSDRNHNSKGRNNSIQRSHSKKPLLTHSNTHSHSHSNQYGQFRSKSADSKNKGKLIGKKNNNDFDSKKNKTRSDSKKRTQNENRSRSTKKQIDQDSETQTQSDEQKNDSETEDLGESKSKNLKKRRKKRKSIFTKVTSELESSVESDESNSDDDNYQSNRRTNMSKKKRKRNENEQQDQQEEEQINSDEDAVNQEQIDLEEKRRKRRLRQRKYREKKAQQQALENEEKNKKNEKSQKKMEKDINVNENTNTNIKKVKGKYQEKEQGKDSEPKIGSKNRRKDKKEPEDAKLKKKDSSLMQKDFDIDKTETKIPEIKKKENPVQNLPVSKSTRTTRQSAAIAKLQEELKIAEQVKVENEKNQEELEQKAIEQEQQQQAEEQTIANESGQAENAPATISKSHKKKIIPGVETVSSRRTRRQS